MTEPCHGVTEGRSSSPEGTVVKALGHSLIAVDAFDRFYKKITSLYYEPPMPNVNNYMKDPKYPFDLSRHSSKNEDGLVSAYPKAKTEAHF